MELKGCPFCGSTELLGPISNSSLNELSWWIECQNQECNCCIEKSGKDKNPVVELWNTRALTPV